MFYRVELIKGKKGTNAAEEMIQKSRERMQRHAMLLHRAESALDCIESRQERQRAAGMIAELKATGSATTYNDSIADYFQNCGFYISSNTQNKYLYKIKFSIDE